MPQSRTQPAGWLSIANASQRTDQTPRPIFQVSQIKKSRNDLDAVVKRNVFGHEHLGCPVKEHNKQRDEKVVLSHGLRIIHSRLVDGLRY